MKKIIGFILLSVLATGAQAGESKFSLFSCGVKMGGKSMVYQPASGSKSDKWSTEDQKVSVNDVVASSFTATKRAQSNRVESQLPAVFTVAKFGCSWR